MSAHKRTISVDEAAKILGIGRCTAYEGIHTGQIPSIRIGKRIVVPVDQLDRMLKGLADNTTTMELAHLQE